MLDASYFTAHSNAVKVRRLSAGGLDQQTNAQPDVSRVNIYRTVRQFTSRRARRRHDALKAALRASEVLEKQDPSSAYFLRFQSATRNELNVFLS